MKLFKTSSSKVASGLYLAFVLAIAGMSAYSAWAGKSWIYSGQGTWKEKGPSSHSPGVHHK